MQVFFQIYFQIYFILDIRPIFSSSARCSLKRRRVPAARYIFQVSQDQDEDSSAVAVSNVSEICSDQSGLAYE